MKTNEIFISNESIADDFIKSFEYPYQVLPNIKNYIYELGKNLRENYYLYDDAVWIHKSAKVHKSAEITGPCIIDEAAEIRPNAYIRGSVIVGKNCVVGNSCELKNVILYNYVQVPHFNYVGDSILGTHSHLGAGAIISNLKADKQNIIIKKNDEYFETNLRKIGAFLGDNVEVGCNCVLNPGTVIYPNSIVYPTTCVRGVIPSNVIVKDMNNIVKIENKVLKIKK